jgi:hypothetical protein
MIVEQNLGDRKICTRFVPQALMLEPEQKQVMSVPSFHDRRLKLQNSLQVTTHSVLSTILQESNRVNSGWENIRQTSKVVVPKILHEENAHHFFDAKSIVH